MKKNKRKSISLFTGAGRMDVGFSRAGFEVVWANDIDADSCKTYRLNHAGEIKCGDLRNYFGEIKTFKDIDLVFGGPPCQGFSSDDFPSFISFCISSGVLGFSKLILFKKY